MSTAQTSGRNSNETNRPVATWWLMVLALIVVALIPDWTESGANRPLWLFVVPIVLGLGGAVFAVRTRHFWWAIVSAVWGFALIQCLILVVTLASGP
ncbi:hypothetical protein SAMN05216368_10380 [Cryobacterium flavum]|uniref:Uncharacterized protein n=1 Tax=Cryobacterium flavum TaxID=1424659 RepID=A0A4R8UUJ0_9MICO|nr:hypothetical protein [Cryobacterium flavum]TFB72515.1 hypothetical protein E3O21_19115 [Cryobacterium flavum]SDM96336.1 hypothetical protein SAMN05216368_10380 [Cryobacterium flavum]